MKNTIYLLILVSIISTPIAFAGDDNTAQKNSNEASTDGDQLQNNKEPVDPTGKVQQKIEDREHSDASNLKDQDRAGKSVEEKRDISSDGPRSDAGEDTPLETQKKIPTK